MFIGIFKSIMLLVPRRKRQQIEMFSVLFLKIHIEPTVTRIIRGFMRYIICITIIHHLYFALNHQRFNRFISTI